ncbi:gamma carbonic anhydrase family protein [Thermococci archaeon]|nr:MAG: gamma carbonic anhydrase family protein [Thermococci archaeon]RLF79855.1 MAG: gamma carbonic anhydrase family protein [Thermococci archaeon]RLF84308.1 MAG: gamma carbonic anhydrase family protein [Thermococci archaeon]RLF84907.1 MAG: gamma carbonic anhydrase family protein [Thermococci archaeon]
MVIYEVNGKRPKIHETAFVDENAYIIGDVVLEEKTSVWPSAVLRGDIEQIYIGKGSNIQDNVSVHTSHGMPTILGEYVTIGHNAVIHGAKIGNHVIIGMGAIVLDGAKIGNHVIIGAGALIPPGKEIPDYSLVVGVPGKAVRRLSEEEIEMTKKNAEIYMELAEMHVQKRKRVE